MAQILIRLLALARSFWRSTGLDGYPRNIGLAAFGVFSGLTEASTVEAACAAEANLAVVFAVVLFAFFAVLVSSAEVVVGRRAVFRQRVAFGVDNRVSASSARVAVRPSVVAISGVDVRHKFALAYPDAAHAASSAVGYKDGRRAAG